MRKMGMKSESMDTEKCLIRLTHDEPSQILYRGLANFFLPRGRRGRIRLCLLRPEQARATAFIAGVLRSIENDG